MVFGINSNASSFNALRNVQQNNTALSKIMERIASQQKINRASDDPAGLIISEELRGQLGAITAGLQGVQEVGNMTAVAEAGLSEIQNTLTQAQGLATLATNGTTIVEQRQALQFEMDNLIQSADRMAQQSNFAGQKLLNGTFNAQALTEPAGPTLENIPLPNATAGALGTAAGGAPLSSILAGGANDLATNPAGALGVIQQSIQELAMNRGEVGAFQRNTLEPAARTLSVAFENLTNAESNIRDLNTAQGAMELAAARIREQYGIGVLSQANVSAQSTLRLLGSL